VLPRKITGSLLKLSSGLPEPVLPGEICRRSLVTGTAFMSVTIAVFFAEYVLADKGYDSNAFIHLIESQGSQAVIPPRRNRKEQRDYDKEVYKERNLV
jgi:hypothetical protein